MKKILQKSLSQLRMLLLLAVMFVAGASAWADELTATFDTSESEGTGGWSGNSNTKSGITCQRAGSYSETQGINLWQATNYIKVTVPSGVKLSKIVLRGIIGYYNGQTYGSVSITKTNGTFENGASTWTTADDATWLNSGEVSEVQFSTTYGNDFYVHYVDVYTGEAGSGGETPATVNSTLNFDSWNLSYSGGSSKPASSTHFNNGEVFSNADGVTMTLTNIPDPQAWPSECFYSNPSGSTMALYLCNGEGFTIGAPSGYEITNIVVNRASTSYSMTSLIIDGVQNTDGTKGTWTGNATSVPFSTISGDASKRILINNIQVTLTPIEEEGEVTYTIDLVDAPAGAYVTLDGQTFDRDNTYTVEKSLGKSDLEAYEPEGYYAEVEYTRDSHTYTVTYKAYNYYDVTVTGTRDANAGVVYDGHTYGDGDRIESKDVLTLSSVTPADVTGYAGTVSMSGNAYTVDYQEKLDYVIATNTGQTTISKDGFTITGGGIYTGSCINLWSSWKLTVESSTLPIERIELEEYAGKTITASSSPEGYNGNNAWVGTPTNRVTFTATNSGDFCIKSVHIYLYKPVSVDYTIDLEGAPAGASVRVNDDQDFTADGTYTTTDELGESNISVTCPDTHYYNVAYNEGSHTFTITFTAYNVYAVTVNGPAEGGVVYDGNDCTDEVKSETVLTVDDVQPIEVAGYDAEVTFDGTTFIVTYTALPALAIGSSATDNEGNYWTSFCFNKPVEFGAGVTPCIVTGAENGKLTIEEFVAEDNEYTVDIDFTTGAYSGNSFTAMDGKLTVEGVNWIFNTGFGYAETENTEDWTTVTFTLADDFNGIIKSIRFLTANDTNSEWFDYTGGYMNDWSEIPVNGKTMTLGAWYDRMIKHFYLDIVEEGDAPVFPANTAVLLKSAAAGAVTYYTRPAGNADVSANILKASGESGFSVSNDASHLYYKLTLNAAGEAGTAGFYWDKNSDEGHSISVPAHKAYLMLDAAAASNYRAYLFGGEGEATGIEAAATVEDNAPVYNLQGQRVNAAKAGVYVKNGKKMIVK